jgi:nitrite reductase/ring-hydroxylating ferredoxin subunit
MVRVARSGALPVPRFGTGIACTRLSMTTTEVEGNTRSHYALCGLADVANRTAKGIALQGVNASGAVETCPLVIVRWDDKVYGYINTCPHTPVQLDARSPGRFFNPERSHLMCEKHGALFEVDTGLCLDGPCEGQGLVPLSLQVVDGSICLSNVQMVDVKEP